VAVNGHRERVRVDRLRCLAVTQGESEGPEQPPVDLPGLLAGRGGRYRGRGIEVDGTEFDGTLTVGAIAAGAAVTLDVRIDQAGEPPYHEHGVLARGEDGTAQYVAVSSNAPFHRTFGLRRTERVDGCARAVFGWGGTPEPTTGFREEITVTVHDDGDLGLGWAWGAPGEPFGPRSAVRLRPDPAG
jgi:hypothetical protein